MSAVVIDFTGIGKEQAHGHELALDSVPAKAEILATPIVSKNLPIVKREFPSAGWVNWGINKEKPKWPYTPQTLRPAKAGQPETWGSITAAVRNVKEKKALGIGYQFNGDGLWGVDLDHAIDPETREIATWAREIIAALDTYTEISPSGTGFHLIARAEGFSIEYHKKPVPDTPGIVEMYGDLHYFTITANVFDGRDKINDRPAALLSVYKRFLEDEPAADRKSSTKPQAAAKPEKYLDAMLKNPTFAALWNGSRPKGDESSDDASLMWHLAYWCNRDPALMKEQFLRSPHCLSKDEPHRKKLTRKVHSGTGELYIDWLVNGALNGSRAQPRTAAEDDKAARPLGLNTGEGASSPALQDYPDIVVLANGSARPAETLENFRVCLKKYGITVGYNCLSREIIPPKDFREKYSPVAINTALLSACQDCCAKERIPKNRDRVAGWLSTVADDNRVHPVQRYLEKLPPAKGEAEIKRLFACLELAEEAPKALAYKLLKKWLVQCVAMAYNDAGSYGADGVLILQGAQGIGKTSFFRALCKDLKSCFKEGAEQNEDKDKIIENTKYWITELGELERSTLKEMGSLKAFITASADEYRAPYGAVSVKYPRYTSFCGTVNELDFLREDGRRWWVISLEDIDLEKLSEIDMKRLWAEAFALWNADKHAFRLTKEEQREVIKLSGNFEKRTVEEQVLLDRLDFSAKETLWRWKTTTEITQQLGLPDAVRMGRVLKKIRYGEKEQHFDTRRCKGSTQYFVPPFITPSYQ